MEKTKDDLARPELSGNSGTFDNIHQLVHRRQVTPANAAYTIRAGMATRARGRAAEMAPRVGSEVAVRPPALARFLPAW